MNLKGILQDKSESLKLWYFVLIVFITSFIGILFSIIISPTEVDIFTRKQKQVKDISIYCFRVCVCNSMCVFVICVCVCFVCVIKKTKHVTDFIHDNIYTTICCVLYAVKY